MTAARCVCGGRLDPAAGDIHPACEQTPDAAFIRNKHPSSRLRGFTDAEWARITGTRRLRRHGYAPPGQKEAG